MELPPLSEYDVIEELGSGTWGTVYKARKFEDDKIYALKFVTPTELAKKLMPDRKMYSLEDVLANEDIGYEYGSELNPTVRKRADNGVAFLEMNYLDGFLSDVIDTKLPLYEKFDIAVQLSKALSVLHGKLGRVHRDLAPDNIGYTSDKDLRLVDFGSSSMLKSDPLSGPVGRLMTRAHEASGKNGMSLSQSDVWSYGALIYKIFTGSYPLESQLKKSKSPDEYLHNISEQKMNFILDFKVGLDPRIPQALRKIVRKCLQYNPERRYSSGVELFEAVDTAVRNEKRKSASKKGRKLILGLGIPTILATSFAFTMNFYDSFKQEQSTSMQDINQVKFYMQDWNNIDAETTNVNIENCDENIIFCIAEKAIPPLPVVEKEKIIERFRKYTNLGFTPDQTIIGAFLGEDKMLLNLDDYLRFLENEDPYTGTPQQQLYMVWENADILSNISENVALSSITRDTGSQAQSLEEFTQGLQKNKIEKTVTLDRSLTLGNYFDLLDISEEEKNTIFKFKENFQSGLHSITNPDELEAQIARQKEVTKNAFWHAIHDLIPQPNSK